MGRLGIVSGSGLDLLPCLDRIDDRHDFRDWCGLPAVSELKGHDHSFVQGTIGERRALLQCGRFHFYQGLTYKEVVAPVDVLHAHGVDEIIFTNATGGLRPDWIPGSLIAVSTIQLWPYQPWKERPDHVKTDFLVEGCDDTGAYTWMHGPCYETRAEINALRHLGANLVGMSAAPEVQRCHELGIKAAVISCVTNNCCAQNNELTHDDVVKVSRQASARLTDLLRNHAVQR